MLCVFGADAATSAETRARLGRAVETAADVAIVTADNPRHESAETIAAQIVAGFQRPERARVLLDRSSAIRWALAEALPGDCVLLAGKGDALYQVVGDAWFAFDDRRIAVEWLCDSGLGSSATRLAARN
jgi:UDP-N-acetylmuramoyl-L-alanyl-D-glutamate--2,6-diaminopimelate ligase